MATLGEVGNAPGAPSRGVTPDLKLIFFSLNLERTLDKTWEDGSGEKTTAKKRSSLWEAMTKKVVEFL